MNNQSEESTKGTRRVSTTKRSRRGMSSENRFSDNQVEPGVSSRERYADIINLAHHQSPTRPRMSAHERAGQSSPYAALTGYGKVVSQTEESVNSRQ